MIVISGTTERTLPGYFRFIFILSLKGVFGFSMNFSIVLKTGQLPFFFKRSYCSSNI